MRRIAPIAALAVTLVLAPRAARAFCGFYVDGAGSKLYNNATQVVLMREGTRTVLSMQNNYQGPPEAFALVVPVPTVLKKEDVKTLDRAIFDRVDKLDAPRLVEYWEQDPCERLELDEGKMGRKDSEREYGAYKMKKPDDLGVTVEAQFVVGEYEIEILSATDSTGLDTWLKREKYAIPDGAEPYLRPYVESNMKFFVAKVDPSKVTFANGMATLSPLRFFYDVNDFTLPVRLGLINSAGTQDLIVHVLSPEGRFEVGNRPSAFIPTNLDVKDDVRTHFAEFYAALFDRTVARHPHAVVTEYAWDARSCDPCPEPPLTEHELDTLGADVGAATPAAGGDRRAYDFTLTRLHVRYGKDDLADDLVFRVAPPVLGGREEPGADGKLMQDATQSEDNNFQGRYVIRHEWTGPITCSDPVRGRWGGPPGDQQIAARPQAAQGLAFAPRGKVRLDELVAADVPALGVRAAGAAVQVGTATSPRATDDEAPRPSATSAARRKGCGCGASESGDASGGALLVFGVAFLMRKKRGAA